METMKASRSAGIIAAHRAIESSKKSEERICYDPFAGRFLPPGFTVIGESDIPEETALNLFKNLVPGFHEFFIARTRYIDDYLTKFINNGLEQLVILGAGFDSRAYRFDELKNNVKIFEVDHPATQSVKKEKLKEIFQMLPDHVTYVPVDFQKENLQSCLSENGYDRHLTTVFIWEGVTMYIDLEAIEETLLFVSQNTGKGSAVIFDYTYHEVVSGGYDRKEAREWLKITEKSAEPLLFGIRKSQTEKFLYERKFCNICNITSEYFNNTYFVGANAGRESTPILAIAHAEIKKS
jgi:methyltransferase (TIGR00027 family)